MPNVDMSTINLFGEYDQKTLADIWKYKSYDAIRRGIVTVAGDNKIILFITEDKATKNHLENCTLYMSGEVKHVNDNRIAKNLDSNDDEIYLFYRETDRMMYTYYGKVTLDEAEIKEDEPSLFTFTVDSLNINFFGFKFSNPESIETVNAVKNKSQNIVIEHLNQLESELKTGSYVFMVLGGDKVSWDKGLIGLAEITNEPFDKGYDKKNPRNFRLGLKMIFVLPEVMRRDEFVGYPDAYDAASIGPNTKGEQNQAIKALEGKQAAAILRAMVEKEKELESVFREIFSNSFQEKIFGKMNIMIKEQLAFGEKVSLRYGHGCTGEVERITGGQNVLLYGVPGCGKSHTIENEYVKDKYYSERVVFHPDYTYSDFIGQIMPVTKNKQLYYEFVEGPFTRILKEAIDHPRKMYYMIIEEINRGNAGAIFGDVFQLLDRKENGESSYDITNYDIAEFVYNDKTKKIKIPSNLTILATMNTSDQSVFAIDTAFKRRWELRLIPNKLNKCDFGQNKILDTDISWYLFVKTINEYIEQESSNLISNEDKRIGAFFIKKKDLELIWDEETRVAKYNPAFAEKILMYLWNDVFKYNHEAIFNEKYKSLEALISGFEKHKFDVFNIKFVSDEENGINEGNE